MELWYTEEHSKDVRFSIRVNKQLYSKKSEFQRIDILESNEFGRVLTLDGLIMVTEKDEFNYHEMITHVPMAVNPNIKKVLIIGGGDGGCVRELSKYKGIEEIHLVEIDEEVVKASIEYLPTIASAFDDKRLTIIYKDGLKYVRKMKNEYDLIIVDSTDPFGPGEGLFTKEFYGSCYNALKEDGILVNQHECDYYYDYAKSMKRAHKRILETFPICKICQANIPTYPSGHWLFGFSSKKYDPVKDFNAEMWDSLNLKTRYYNTELHKAAFVLPNYIKEMMVVEDEE